DQPARRAAACDRVAPRQRREHGGSGIGQAEGAGTGLPIRDPPGAQGGRTRPSAWRRSLRTTSTRQWTRPVPVRYRIAASSRGSASPMSTHYRRAGGILEAGKHVLVEKPLATTAEDCERLIEAAERARAVLMVGHVFEYNPAVLWVKDYLRRGELGAVQYVCSRRLNLGRIQTDLNAMWSFAPHDVSILLYWFEQMPVAVSARGFSYLNPGVEDVVFTTLEFPGGMAANLHSSWLDPKKIRDMTVVGARTMLVYDDVSTDAKIQLYDKGVVRV